MEWSKSQFKNHDGRQYWRIQPRANNADDSLIIQNWRDLLEEDGGIVHSFIEMSEPIITNIMNGARGEFWEYLPLDEEQVDWPNEFIIYEI